MLVMMSEHFTLHSNEGAMEECVSSVHESERKKRIRFHARRRENGERKWQLQETIGQPPSANSAEDCSVGSRSAISSMKKTPIDFGNDHNFTSGVRVTVNRKEESLDVGLRGLHSTRQRPSRFLFFSSSSSLFFDYM